MLPLASVFLAGRTQALEEAAQIAILMADNEADGYYGQACHEVAAAIRKDHDK
jgi:hypothetical protein